MSTAAIVVAAGRGQRAGGEAPKQWQVIAGKPVIAHTLDAFDTSPHIDRIVVVLHPDDQARGAALQTRDLIFAVGGADRSASVRSGLAALQGTGTTRVLIHDVARPCVSHRLISDVIAALATAPGAAPALAVSDALWTGANGIVTGTLDRTGLYRAQTPQGFDYAAICAAHAAHPGGAADDVEVARAAGMTVAIVAGDDDNLKITLPADFARAERILRNGHGH
jgi:2-C-methyl-D-erythritol 4-phosphate cytidylyltransferase